MPTVRIVVHGPDGHDIDFEEIEPAPDMVADTLIADGNVRTITTGSESPEQQLERMLEDGYLRVRKAYGLDR